MGGDGGKGMRRFAFKAGGRSFEKLLVLDPPIAYVYVHVYAYVYVYVYVYVYIYIYV